MRQLVTGNLGLKCQWK